MGQPVVHFEVTGHDPEGLRRFFGDLFGWEYDLSSSVAPTVSEPGAYGFIDTSTTEDGVGIPGGVGGGPNQPSQAIFYVFVPDVEAALAEAERLGGTRRMGPAQAAGRDLVVGHFADPEGHVIGVAGPA
jgi:predicted enzyme related to lactoylglutathione lyase